MGFEPKLTLCIGIVLLSGAANCKKHFTFVIVCSLKNPRLQQVESIITVAPYLNVAAYTLPE